MKRNPFEDDEEALTPDPVKSETKAVADRFSKFEELKPQVTESLKMKVEGITIRNFKGIQNERISIKGNNVYVMGRNGMGKTSFLDAIFKIISGKDMPAQPTMQGAKTGDISIDLGKIIVKASFNSAKEKISVSVESKDGQEYKSPRKMLDEIIGVIDFDVTKFLEMPPKKQVELIKSLSGIDFTDFDDQYKKLYEERTFINKKVIEAEARAVVYDKNKVTVVDLADAMKLLNEKRDFNNKYKDNSDTVVLWTKRKADIIDEADNLMKRLKELEAEDTALIAKIAEGNAWLKDESNQPHNIEAEEKAYQDNIKNNEEAQKNIEAQKQHNELQDLIKYQEELNDKMEFINKSKREHIANTEFPVPGLSLTDEGLTLNGLPFESSQINKAQQIITGLQINLKLLGDVKIARFEGSLIDNENMEYIEDWAKKNDLQLFVELVDRSAEKLKIEVREVQ